MPSFNLNGMGHEPHYDEYDEFEDSPDLLGEQLDAQNQQPYDQHLDDVEYRNSWDDTDLINFRNPDEKEPEHHLLPGDPSPLRNANFASQPINEIPQNNKKPRLAEEKSPATSKQERKIPLPIAIGSGIIALLLGSGATAAIMHSNHSSDKNGQQVVVTSTSTKTTPTTVTQIQTQTTTQTQTNTVTNTTTVSPTSTPTVTSTVTSTPPSSSSTPSISTSTITQTVSPTSN